VLGRARLNAGVYVRNVVYIFVTDVKGYERMIVPVVIALAVLAIILYRYFVRKNEGETGMELDSKLVRELQKKFELELNKREIEITENWRNELETIYKKRYENLNSLLNDMKNLMERMTNRVKILTRIVREGA